MTGTEGATAEIKVEGPVTEKTAAEIEDAVNQINVSQDEPIKDKETEEKPPVKDTPKEGEENTADQGDEKTKEADQEPQGEKSPDEHEGEEDTSEAEARSDELLTRAVKAGMSLKDARTIVAQDADALDRQIGLLEKASQPKAGEGDADADAGESVAAKEDPMTGIPELDPEIYDEKIVEVVQGLKSIIRKQGDTIKQLSSGEERSWFNKQVDSLNVKNFDEAKRTELSDQFDVLKAGNAAKGHKVDDAVVFQQATKLVLGDEMQATKTAEKSAKLKKRADMQTARPGRPAAKVKGDPFDEVAREVDKEVFNKK